LFQKDYWERKSLKDRRKPTHPVILDYTASKLRRIRKVFSWGPQTRLLDVGCGNGFFSQAFSASARVMGVDYSQRMLGLNPITDKAVMDANRLCFQDMAFDVVFCHMLLHHVEDMDHVLREMRRVSKRYVVIIEPNRNNPLMFLFSLLVPEERKGLIFTQGFLRDKMERNGLKVLSAVTCGTAVPNKWPTFLLPLARLMDWDYPWGMTHLLIAERKERNHRD